MQEILDGVTTLDVARQIRSWNVFFFFLEMLVCRPPRGRKLNKEKLTEQLENFRNGKWIDLVRGRRQRRSGDDVESRAARASFVPHSQGNCHLLVNRWRVQRWPLAIWRHLVLSQTTTRILDGTCTSFQVRSGSFSKNLARRLPNTSGRWAILVMCTRFSSCANSWPTEVV